MDTFTLDTLNKYVNNYKHDIILQLSNSKTSDKSTSSQPDLINMVLDYSPKKKSQFHFPDKIDLTKLFSKPQFSKILPKEKSAENLPKPKEDENNQQNNNNNNINNNQKEENKSRKTSESNININMNSSSHTPTDN